ncbi:Serine/threonine-protein kinase AFC2 [Dichanthelium oligosanthes]|uniref:Serine/threonine-protein kinase AFC2 n=1 Tax=Dichanthelium oligosanthes TaxID=888268 RepID=A0A1E5VB85_9POAL|nr:Serine/threonine-protein kinase AFC2 [Dichanthelium oligosanthes]
MECIAEMPRAPLDRRPRKRQRLGWDVGPAEMHQVQIGLCGQEVVNAISAVALGLSSGGIVSSQLNQVQPRDGSPPLREDDKDGHYVFAVGDNLTPRYKINAKMGEGTFGQVLECWDRERKEMVAIKIIRGIKKYRDAAMIEIGMLEELGKYDESRSSCVQIRNWFDYRNHICIVSTMLDYANYELTQRDNLMHELRLIHTDLKPENILLVSPECIKVPDYKVSPRSPKEGSYYKRLPKSSAIKVIDFGSTTYDQQDQSYVDLDGVTHVISGVLVAFLLSFARRHSEKYIRKGRLNWPEGCTSRESMKAVMKLPRLQNLVMQNVDQSAGDFIDLLQGLLKYDPANRMTAQEALSHPFFTEGFERRR